MTEPTELSTAASPNSLWPHRLRWFFAEITVIAVLEADAFYIYASNDLNA